MKQTLLQLDEKINSKVLEIANEMKYNKTDTIVNLIRRGIKQYELSKKDIVAEEKNNNEE